MKKGVIKLAHTHEKSSIANEVLFNVFVTLVGIVSPLDAMTALMNGTHYSPSRRMPKNAQERTKARSTFNYLVKKGYIAIENRGAHIDIHLTPTGKKKAQTKEYMAMASHLSSQRPSIWDGKWRLILFDIPTEERVKRNAFRAIIRKLGAVMLQKSVWVYPYDCRKELGMLGDFFGLTQQQLRIVVAEDIADDVALRQHYKLAK